MTTIIYLKKLALFTSFCGIYLAYVSSIDNTTKNAVIQSISNMIKPTEKTPIRFILVFSAGESNYKIIESNKNESSESSDDIYISKGTTRFEHNSKEYIRAFTTSNDGFINISVNPNFCMNRATLLTKNGQRIAMAGTYNMIINKEVPKGEYKLLLKTNATCDVNLIYP